MTARGTLLSDFVHGFSGELPVRLKLLGLQSAPLTGSDALAGRLSDFGFRSGEIIEWVGRAPFRGPFLFSVRGALVALRAEEVARLSVEPLPGNGIVGARSQVSGA